MKRLFISLMVIAIVAGTSAFTSYEKDTVKEELKAVKYSAAYTKTDTYLKVTLSNDEEVPLVVPGDILTSDEIELLIESFTSKQLIAMVEAPDCDDGWVTGEDYIGTNFVKLTCSIPNCCGPMISHDECKTYNPYTHRWQAMSSCSPWNYE